MKYIHTKTKKSKYFSLLIIPHSNNIKQFKIATWVPKLLIFTIIISLSTTIFLFFSYRELKNKYLAKLDELDYVNSINIKQKAEIETLREKTTEIQEKLDTISKFQEKIKNMIGIKDNKKEKRVVNPSRSGNQFFKEKAVLEKLDNSIISQIDELSKLLDNSKEELIKLTADVEKKMKYLDAKPNLMPAKGKITSGYGYRRNPFGKGREFHKGLDITNKPGTKIRAAGSGIVTFAGYYGGYGKVIIISHGYGYQSIYGHNRKLLVKVGQHVKKGEVIAEMGNTGRSTGPHLHFEIRYYGKAVNPKNVIDNYK
ncbi:Murein DD-endopeptidase MepM and murein hydrolase activator NlpD, contain LysM domain [Caloranaerobacter azorensis DSM 13643]|uniref:Murein DD-endopeptidase MepM and murein hydrolase activator NlpD, contain LysM domain n=1 Tax=Caloranaerobacter azorensis DSM 13643 TaxID=1121264 RepID=A0A1M5SPN0_9FIRM|nr:M23 family metallopeptidase [Caloranaerobacter azorensis]SHH40357.1 Murein DD-endopeptidase MepM and murein hydrolase activator NlpD, contain LysM domain [Caloranaerobacter azorensis DSM 13643]